MAPRPPPPRRDPRLDLAPANDATGLGRADVEAMPLVGQPPSRALPAVAAVLIIATAAALFLSLNARRLERETPALAASTLQVQAQSAPLPILDLPPDEPIQPPPEAAPPEIEVAAAPAPFLPPLAPPSPVMPLMPQISGAPALVVDYGPGRGSTDAAAPGAPPRGVPGPGMRGVGVGQPGSLESLALQPGSGDEPDRVTATRLENPSRVVPQGVIIPAVLETAIDSNLPGFARAVVSRDVLSFDGSAVLIPRGSRLIGRYKSDLAPGQSRVFVAWTRVMRPDGASIQLDSPATDPLGRGGLEGQLDRRLLDRFGGSALLSALNAGASALANGRSSQVIISSQLSGPDPGGARGQQIPPVVRIAQGAPIRIFVARDLDFSTVGEARGPVG